MIAIVAETYEDAAGYMEAATTTAASWGAGHTIAPPDLSWIIVLRPEDIRPGLVLTGAVFLADGEVGQAVRRALAASGLGDTEHPQAVED